MQVVGWIGFSIVALFAVTWSVSIPSVRRRGGVPWTLISTICVWWLLLVWTLFGNVDQLHLFWLAPLARILPSRTHLALIARRGPRGARWACNPAIWLIVFACLLWLLEQASK